MPTAAAYLSVVAPTFVPPFRVVETLPVSPPPAQATFNDVPVGPIAGKMDAFRSWADAGSISKRDRSSGHSEDGSRLKLEDAAIDRKRCGDIVA